MFDASARTTFGTSLHDILLTGPNLYPLLTNVVLSVRMHAIGKDLAKFGEVSRQSSIQRLRPFLDADDSSELADVWKSRYDYRSDYRSEAPSYPASF